MVGVHARMKYLRLYFTTSGGPIANNFAVLEDNRPENAVAAVGAVHVVGMDGQLAALVTNKVFVVGREEVNVSAPESAGAAILVAEESKPFPAFLYEFVPDGIESIPTISDVEATPPYEVFQGGRAVAAEVGSGQFGQGFFPGY